MSNIVIDALKSKLDSLKSQQADLKNQVNAFDADVFNDWKARYIDNVPFISSSAKENVIIERDGTYSLRFKTTAKGWSDITLKRNANWRSVDGIRPELNWFGSSADKDDKNGYLDLMQILGLISNYMQSGLNAWDDLLMGFDLCVANEKKVNGDIDTQLYEIERSIRDAEYKQKQADKETMLAKGKIELPSDINWLAQIHVSGDKWGSRRFTNLRWVENKGGKTYKVTGWTMRKNDDGVEEKRNDWFVERVKKYRLLDGIENAMKRLEDYNEEKATETVA